MLPNNNLALYIHWPFCKSKCPYCDFNSHVQDKIDHKTWLQAYLTELRYFQTQLGNRKITSIFFGGGTPSLMQPEVVEGIIDEAYKLWQVINEVEITLEANPTSIEAKKLINFRKAGINRVSLGVQALNDSALKFLGREHSSEEAIAAIKTAANIFDNYSFDLIYARPEQTLKTWKEELEKALELVGPHLSLYQLTIEKGTKFFSEYNDRKFVMPEEDLSATMFELTQEVCNSHGLPAYEISNHAKSGFESKHNLAYWEQQEYLGIGPGAHSRYKISDTKYQTMMVHKPENWLTSVMKKEHGTQVQKKLNKTALTKEFLMMGLRLDKGIKKERFKEVLGIEFEKILDKKILEELIIAGMVEENKNYIKVSMAGKLLLNSIIEKLISGLSFHHPIAN